MAETVSLSVQADLRRVQADIEGLGKRAALVAQQVKRVGDELDKNLQRNTKVTEQHFERLRDLGRRLADQLRGYFASIATQTAQSLESVKKNLGLKQQFIDATKSAVELHDVIRKLGGSLDIANGRLGDFQRNITKAFTEAGFGADAAGRALTGIAGTRVSGEEASQHYALQATKLAQAGGQTGQEGEIAREIANNLRLRGIDQNDLKAVDAVVNSVRGRNPLDKLQGQNALYGAMEPQNRGQYSPQTMAGFAAVRKEAGPEIDAFLAKMSQGWLNTLPAKAQGLGKIMGPNGINFDEVLKHPGVFNRLGKDTAASGATFGLSPEEAKGAYALYVHAKRARKAQDEARNRGGSLDEDVEETRGLGESAEAVKNRIGGKIQNLVSRPLGTINDLLNKASKSDLGSAAVMGGGFLAAAGGALAAGKLASKLGGKGGAGAAVSSIAKAGMVEQITGQKTMPVYVVNVAEFGLLGGGVGGAANGAASMTSAAGKLANAAKLLGAAGIGLAAGEGINWLMTDNKTDERTGVGGNKLARLWADMASSKFGDIARSIGINLTDYAGTQEDIARNQQAIEEKKMEMRKRGKQLAKPSRARRGESFGEASSDE